jgi:RNA polymerase sigma-70 factor (ECF subfamily)
MDPELPELSTDLVTRAKQGDQDALNELLVVHQEPLRRIVRVRLGARLRRKVESMDIVQEALMVAAKNIHKEEFQSSAAIRNWLARIAEHKITDAHDYFTAQRREPAREQSVNVVINGESVGWDVPGQGPSPHSNMAGSELFEIVDEAMTELSEDHREVILMRQYCGAGWSEIASSIGRTLAATQELHRRGWERLQSIVAPRVSPWNQ